MFSTVNGKSGRLSLQQKNEREVPFGMHKSFFLLNFDHRSNGAHIHVWVILVKFKDFN